VRLAVQISTRISRVRHALLVQRIVHRAKLFQIRLNANLANQAQWLWTSLKRTVDLTALTLCTILTSKHGNASRALLEKLLTRRLSNVIHVRDIARLASIMLPATKLNVLNAVVAI
jgi:hypothetical protein